MVARHWVIHVAWELSPDSQVSAYSVHILSCANLELAFKRFLYTFFSSSSSAFHLFSRHQVE